MIICNHYFILNVTIQRYCTDEDIVKYYNNTGSTPSFSPFLNSGLVMGSITGIRTMLEYVIKNNASYFIKHVKTKFDDQYAYTGECLQCKENKGLALFYNFHGNIEVDRKVHHLVLCYYGMGSLG